MAIKLSTEEQIIAYNKYLIEQDNINNDWDPKSIFCSKSKNIKNLNKFVIEIGSGNGDFLIHLSEHNEEIFYIGIEMKRKRINKCVSKSYKKCLNNIGFILGDAKIILIKKALKENSINEFYITFPDPWPKTKHIKNRLINNEFIETLHSSLKTDGKLTIVTDHKNYLDEIINSIEYIGKFKYKFENKITTHIDNFYMSYFEKLWREKGKEIYYCVLIKK